MTLIEWIGFFVSLFGLFFLFGRGQREKQKDPDAYLRDLGFDIEEEQEEDIEEEEEIAEIEPPSPPLVFETPVKVVSTPSFNPPASSKLAELIHKLPDKRMLLISQILFGPPKSEE